MFYHRKVLKHPENKQNQRPVYRAFRELLQPGKEFVERKVFASNDETVCLLEEQRRIREYGFENLLNVASHAFTGRKLKPSVGKLIGEKLKDYVQRCRDQYGTGHPPEVIERIRRSSVGKVISSECARKISDSKKGKPLSVQHRKSLTGLNRNFTEKWKEGRKKASESLKRVWSSGAVKRKTYSEYNRSKFHNRTYTLESPKLETFTVNSSDLKNFCEIHGINQKIIVCVSRGLRPHHRGWKAKRD